MKEADANDFGLLIAFVLPGVVVLWGFTFHSPTIAAWFGAVDQGGPAVGGFLYLVLTSVGAGLIVSTLRWLIVDQIHFRTGIPRRMWDYSVLPQSLPALEFLIANQYRYYQFYANTFVAVALASGAFLASSGTFDLHVAAIVVFVEVVLWAGSRDTLRNYHSRVAAFLSEPAASDASQIPEPAPIRENPGPDLLKAPGLIGYSRWVVVRRLFSTRSSGKSLTITESNSETTIRN